MNSREHATVVVGLRSKTGLNPAALGLRSKQHRHPPGEYVGPQKREDHQAENKRFWMSLNFELALKMPDDDPEG
jgi:hypothetical protein